MNANGLRAGRRSGGAEVHSFLLSFLSLISTLVVLAFVGFFLSACGRDSLREETTIRSDSAGVEIVLNLDPAVGEGVQGTLLFPPVLSLGSEEAGPELFGAIGWLRLDRSGRLWVSDRQAQDLRVFDLESGEHLMTLGGPGEGPEEYRRMRPLGFDDRGFAHIYDDALRRLTIYSENGEIEHQTRILTSEEFSPRPFHVTGSGMLMGQIPRPRIGEVTDGQLLQDTVRIWSIDPDGAEPRLVAAQEGPLFFYHSFQSTPVPFRTGARFGFSGDRVYFTHPKGEASFLVFGVEGMERRVVVDRVRHPVSAKDVENYIDYLRSVGWSEEMVRPYEIHRSDMPVPDLKPVWDYPLIDELGGIWLLRVPTDDSGEMTWDVFDPSGALRGRITTPKGLLVYQVTARHVVGVLRDEFDREGAVVLQFSFPRG